MSCYLKFACDALNMLLEKQSVRLGGTPDGPLCITITERGFNDFLSVGFRDGEYKTYKISGAPMEEHPVRLDMEAWSLLELASQTIGDDRYANLVAPTVQAFIQHGFHQESGLGYLGKETQFDVVALKPRGIHGNDAKFKPGLGLPLETLWNASPQKTERMLRSTFQGLITRPGTMDYNRFCFYDFSDAAPMPAMEFNPTHIAFAQTGAILIHWWCFLFAQTECPQALKWARAMFEKWSRVQHPTTGLIPHWFSNSDSSADVMLPSTVCRVDDSLTAISLLKASRVLLTCEPQFAAEISEMAVRLLRGLAKYGYDEGARIFSRWIKLDGTPDLENVWYTFPTQALKDEAVKQDASLNEVAVFRGHGFFLDGPWAHGVRNNLPHDVALGALWTNDAELQAAAQRFTELARQESQSVSTPRNELGQWTCSALASYSKAMLYIWQKTEQEEHLQGAKELCDKMIATLTRDESTHPEWWRMDFRDDVIGAFLLLHQALENRVPLDAKTV
jgi:hypothetical protein